MALGRHQSRDNQSQIVDAATRAATIASVTFSRPVNSEVVNAGLASAVLRIGRPPTPDCLAPHYALRPVRRSMKKSGR
jgi:hypothetical protein